MADPKMDRIPEGYDDFTIDPKTGKVELKRPSDGPSKTNWPDADKRSK